MQNANLKLPALEVIDLENELIAKQEIQVIPRIHPLAIKEGAMLECTRADNGKFYTVGKHYEVLSVINSHRMNFPITMEDNHSNSHCWSTEALAGIGEYEDYGTQFKLVVWTKQ